MNTLAAIVVFTLLGGVLSAAIAGLFLLLPERRRVQSLPHMVSFATGALLGAALLALVPHAVIGAGLFQVHDVGIALVAGIGLFFVLDVTSGTDRGYRCGECGETFELRDTAAPSASTPATPLPPQRAPRDLLTVLEAEREQRIIDQARRDLAVEDELAALKKKLGK